MLRTGSARITGCQRVISCFQTIFVERLETVPERQAPSRMKIAMASPIRTAMPLLSAPTAQWRFLPAPLDNWTS